MSGGEPFSIPEGWSWAKVGDVVTRIEAGSSFRCVERPPESGEPAIIKISAVTWGEFRPDQSKVVLDRGRLDVADRIVEGDFLFSRANTLELVGACVIAGPHEQELYLSDKILRFRFAGEFKNWLLWWLRTPEGRKSIQSASSGNQLSMRNIGQQAIQDLPLPLPPLTEQHRIVERIEALLAKGAKAKAALDTLPALLDRYRQALVAAAFQEPEEDWPEVVVADVAATIFDGPFGSNLKSADYSEAGVRVVRLENIGHLEFHSDKRTYIPQEKYQTLVRHTLKPRDVLFSSFVDEQVRVCLFPDDASPAINKADCFVVRCNTDKCLPEFLAYRLACRSVFKRLEEGIHGATRPRINLGQLKAISFHLPPISQQVKIVRQLEAALSKVRALNEQIEEFKVQLGTLNASILAKAFRGELVPQDPADEPASVLLARIRAERGEKPKRGRARKEA